MNPEPHFPAIRPLVPYLDVPTPFDAVLSYPPLKAILPLPILLLLAPVIWWMFRSTWTLLDQESRAQRLEGQRLEDQKAEGGGPDYRAIVCLALLGVTLTIQDYYGGRAFFGESIEPVFRRLESAGYRWLNVDTYRVLYGYCWWAIARIVGYVVVPIAVFKLLFPEDRILDMGLRVRGLREHLWLYGLCLLVVFATMAILSGQRDFLNYYPFYKGADRSWFDLLVWEGFYFLQFFALEFYFRGFILHALRKSMGSVAIFVTAVPYCMIHYGKPYLEAHGALVAGIVLGSLAMRTHSIYAGFLVHISVAGLMDYFALMSRGGLPTKFWP